MLQLWRQQDDELISTPIDGPLQLAEGAAAPQLIPLPGGRGQVGVLLIPDVFHHAVILNGMPVSAGLQLLSHADQFDFGSSTYWVAAAATVESEVYAPDRDGGDDFCFITKTRLEAGMRIIRCPGRPGCECGIIYKQEAWELAIAGNPRFRCPQCGFDPAAAQWEPQPRQADSLGRLFALAQQHHGQAEQALSLKP